MKAIVVTRQAAGTAGVKLVERPEPQATINDVVVHVHASAFTGDELAWPSTWTDRVGRDRTPSIPGHELAGMVTALGYGTTGAKYPFKFVELGRGKVDLPSVFSALEKIKYLGWAVVELDRVPDKARTPKESALISKRYLEEAIGVTV